jgi:hypothetical protein
MHSGRPARHSSPASAIRGGPYSPGIMTTAAFQAQRWTSPPPAASRRHPGGPGRYRGHLDRLTRSVAASPRSSRSSRRRVSRSSRSAAVQYDLGRDASRPTERARAADDNLTRAFPVANTLPASRACGERGGTGRGAARRWFRSTTAQPRLGFRSVRLCRPPDADHVYLGRGA